MHTRRLGQGLEVSAIGYGCMGLSQSYLPLPTSWRAWRSSAKPTGVRIVADRNVSRAVSSAPPAKGTWQPCPLPGALLRWPQVCLDKAFRLVDSNG